MKFNKAVYRDSATVSVHRFLHGLKGDKAITPSLLKFMNGLWHLKKLIVIKQEIVHIAQKQNV